jgi:hypothetical protein
MGTKFRNVRRELNLLPPRNMGIKLRSVKKEVDV